MKIYQLVLLALAGALYTGASKAAIINGDFATGDFSGWTASGSNDTGAPIIDLGRFISINSQAAEHFASIRSGQFSEGLFFGSLEQRFTFDPGTPLFNFDFTLPQITQDTSGTGSSLFSDSILLSLFDGTNSFELLALDRFGISADPFGTAPGSVAIGSSTNPLSDHSFSADLSSLTSVSDLTLFLDVISEDDGFVLESSFDNFSLLGKPIIRPFPEPAVLYLLILGVLTWPLATANNSRRNKSC